MTSSIEKNNLEEAIKKTSGPCIILAGAGTGKTHTIVEKIKYFIQNNIYSPEKIVCITFSNEAAANVFMRVRKSLDIEYGKEPIIKTFHAFSADLLRKYGSHIGIPEDFKILDPNEAKVILHKNLRIQPYYCRKYISTISTAKDLGITLEDLQKYLLKQQERYNGIELEKHYKNIQFELQVMHLKKDSEKKKILSDKLSHLNEVLELKKFVNSWSAYEKIKAKYNCQDYADLSWNALLLLKKFPEIASNFSCLIVDEFQDTNKVQLDFLLALASHGNITIVGDLNQSIYRFRGAYKENFALFKKHFNVLSKDIFNLAKSFRSPNSVLRTAHRLILNNYNSPEECFFVENAEGRKGAPIEIYELVNGKEEARKVVSLIQEEIKSGRKPEEICVMFRTHQQGRVIRKALEIVQIPYSSVTKNSLLILPEIKIVIDYITILNKIQKEERGGEQELWDLLYQSKFSEQDLIFLGKFLKEHKDEKCISKTFLQEMLSFPVSSDGKLCLKILRERFDLLLLNAHKDTSALISEVYSITGLLVNQKSRDGKALFLNLHRFLELSQHHSKLYSPDLGSFLHYLDVLNNLEIEIPSAEVEGNGVQLMTAHATKGLEYSVVILTNMAQKRFPIERADHSILLPRILYPDFTQDFLGQDFSEEALRKYELHHQLSEERRLCYVAFTRAKEKLILTYAKEYAGKKAYHSLFLDELDYTKNSDFTFQKDHELKYQEPIFNLKPASSFASIVSSPHFEAQIQRVASSLSAPPSKEQRSFSPSALLLFYECQKKYEYQYIYNMPEKKTISWEAMRLGSFIHSVLEYGVQNKFYSSKEFVDYAKELHLNEDWALVDFSEAEHMIKVFFERNKDKYNEKSRTEQVLTVELGGFPFVGFADRIDEHPQGIEIIDYKTGRQEIAQRHRNWQLGYYALAAGKFGKVHKITLDMLKQEQPLEFIIDEKGNAQGVNTERMDFNIYEVEQELISTAKSISEARSKGFKPCPLEKNCEFCNEYVWRI